MNEKSQKKKKKENIKNQTKFDFLFQVIAICYRMCVCVCYDLIEYNGKIRSQTVKW